MNFPRRKIDLTCLDAILQEGKTLYNFVILLKLDQLTTPEVKLIYILFCIFIKTFLIFSKG